MRIVNNHQMLSYPRIEDKFTKSIYHFLTNCYIGLSYFRVEDKINQILISCNLRERVE